MDLFVILSEKFQYDVLIDLDMIKMFKLSQDENLKITQTLIDSKWTKI